MLMCKLDDLLMTGTPDKDQIKSRVALNMDNANRVPVWTGLDTTPGAWEAWRIAVVGIAGERGLYDLVAPGTQIDEKSDSIANRNLWFLLARATGSPAVGIMRGFEGRTRNPDGRGAWRRLEEVYGGMTAEEKPQQLLRAELRLAGMTCTGPTGATNYLVGLGELWALFVRLDEPKTDNAKKAALIRGIRESLPGLFHQLVVADSRQSAELLAIHEATQATLKTANLLEELGCSSHNGNEGDEAPPHNEGGGGGQQQ